VGFSSPAASSAAASFRNPAQRYAVAVAEVKFGKVAVQMLLAAKLIYALHAALKDAEKAFHGVAVNVALHILADAVKGITVTELR
jgi:hypothetical protein